MEFLAPATVELLCLFAARSASSPRPDVLYLQLVAHLTWQADVGLPSARISLGTKKALCDPAPRREGSFTAWAQRDPCLKKTG